MNHYHPSGIDGPRVSASLAQDHKEALLAAALIYAERGLPIFPCNSRKQPYIARGFKSATTNQAQIKDWWGRWPDGLIGLPTGAATNICALDIDIKDDVSGYVSIPDWELLSPVVVRTRSGGAHLYFSHESGVRNSAGSIAPGIDVRAEGGYVIAPPSHGYEFLKGDIAALSHLPPWPKRFLPCLTVAVRQSRPTSARFINSDNPIPEGRRNASLASVAGTMRRRGLHDSEILPALLAVNAGRCVPPLDEVEVERIARSICRYPLLKEIQTRVEDERRRLQREENAQIGKSSDAIPTTEIHTLEEMLERFVFIRDGSQVADATCPHSILSLTDFRNATAGSKHQTFNPDGGTKTKAASQIWLEHPSRLEAETLTFRAGANTTTTSPNGRDALNLWRPRPRPKVPENWNNMASRFEAHIQWLWGEDAEAFLDWLAHIEQQPGVLPHFGWLHASREHGTGRNWVSCVLARVWRGHVAASLDLVGMLEGKFNDRLSRCLLAIVDEINEGGSQKYRHADTLRQLVTAEMREINPKYGRRHIEYNAARWLIFSNHAGALPLDEHDRRFWVVSHEGGARDEAYYTRLYSLLSDPGFIPSIIQLLRQRDISQFNPGKRPPMTAAKAALVSLSRTADDEVCVELVARWPVDVITANELNVRLPGFDGLSRPAGRHAMERAGIRRLRKVRTGRGPEMVYAVRHCGDWANRDAQDLKAEIGRASDDEKLKALTTDGDSY